MYAIVLSSGLIVPFISTVSPSRYTVIPSISKARRLPLARPLALSAFPLPHSDAGFPPLLGQPESPLRPIVIADAVHGLRLSGGAPRAPARLKYAELVRILTLFFEFMFASDVAQLPIKLTMNARSIDLTAFAI